ncbi:DUF6270 domain-containing protein [Aeromonas sanarellii]|uniref:DUF6270 domain-containing protein n=1 Tax=Aeromonas sanarellii TaxID=633415 RepID=UPI0038D0D3FA
MEILIYGSCVSRDALEFDKTNKLKIKDYFARSSLASSMSSKKIEGLPIDKITSSFQRRMVESDLNKNLLQIIKESNYDILLIDFIDERFDLWVTPNGSVCTISNELISSGFTPPKNEILKSGSEQWFTYWEAGWVLLINALNDSGNIHKLLINEVYWSNMTIGNDNYLPHYSSAGIHAANATLNKIYNRIKNDISESQFIKFNEDDFIGADSHKWGKSPFHYQDLVYNKIINKLHTQKNNKYDGFVHSPPPFCDFLIVSAKEVTPYSYNLIRKTAIKIGLNIRHSEQLIIISNSPLYDSTIISGYGSYNNITIHHDSGIILHEKYLEQGVGNYTACIIQNESRASIYQDYFGMGSTYYAHNDQFAVASNRAHLIFIFSNLLGIKEPNRNNIYSKLLDHFFFSGQAFNNETPISGIFRTPLNHNIVISCGDLKIVKNSDEKTYQHSSYKNALDAGIKELKTITKNAIDLLTHKDSIICCDLSGGKDSRAALAVLKSVCDEKYYIRTNDVKNSDDLRISTEIASHYNLNYIDHSNDISLPISYSDGIQIWRSYFMGDYHRMGLPNRSAYGSSKTVRIGGGAGEIYRDFWSKIINKSSFIEINAVLDSLFEKEFFLLKKIKKNDLDNISKYIKESFSLEISSNHSFESLSEHYLKFRNRSHFGMRHVSTFHDAIYVFPLLSPSREFR